MRVNLKIKHIKKKLNGTYRKKLDNSVALKYKWKASTSIEKGLAITINDYLKYFLFTKRKSF